MDFSQPYQTPDLAAVLQTLASCAPAKPAPVQQAQEDELEDGEYDPSQSHPIISHPTQPPSLNPQPFQYNGHHDAFQRQLPQENHSALQFHTPTLSRSSSITPGASSQPPQPSPIEKASNITTYPPALRHTTNLLSTSPTTVSRIRHLIHKAHTHERQWWSSRQSLHTQLSTRSASRQKLNTVLASIGGHVSTSTSSKHDMETAVNVEKELKAYDAKVHKAYSEMVKATYTELGKLGIPFFCTRGELVVREGGEVEKGTVGDRELGVLRGRMVGFLEEWVREEG
ncbi:MAG: hypothetical protein Q9176_006414 [Flavoplaca citrina]